MSAKAVKMRTFRLPGLMGAAILSRMCSFRCWSLASSAGVTFSISPSSASITSRSACRSCSQEGRSMSARLNVDLAADLLLGRRFVGIGKFVIVIRLGVLEGWRRSVKRAVLPGVAEVLDAGQSARGESAGAF